MFFLPAVEDSTEWNTSMKVTYLKQKENTVLENVWELYLKNSPRLI